MQGLESLLRGVLKYRQHVRPQMLEQFQRVRDNPKPNAVMFSCMDSRVIATRLLQSDVGDMFLVRNAGNLVPHAKLISYDSATTEPAALYLGCVINNIKHVIVSGHSDCKAMAGTLAVRDSVKVKEGNALELWLKRHAASSLTKFEQLELSNYQAPLTFSAETPKKTFQAHIDPENKFAPVDKFSQVNVLQQLQNIASHAFLRKKLENDEVHLHALWFDIYTGDFYMFCRTQQRYIPITEETYQDLIEDLEKWTKDN